MSEFLDPLPAPDPRALAELSQSTRIDEHSEQQSRRRDISNVALHNLPDARLVRVRRTISVLDVTGGLEEDANVGQTYRRNRSPDNEIETNVNQTYWDLPRR